MFAALELDPIRRTAGTIGTIPTLGHRTLKTKLAGLAKQVRPNLAQFELTDEDAFRPPRQQACLRMVSGNFLRSSPSSERMSNA
jgi:hypothetical protein